MPAVRIVTDTFRHVTLSPIRCGSSHLRVGLRIPSHFIVVAVIVAAAFGFELAAMRHSRFTFGAQAMTAEDMIEADETKAAVLAEMGDSAQVSGR